MKKSVLAILFLLAAMPGFADDYAYPYMAFKQSGGSVTTLSVNSMVLTIQNGTLYVTNSATNKSFTLSTLSSMYFSTTSEGDTEPDPDPTTISAAPTPTKDASNVKSIYSGAYTSPTLSVPEWAWQWLKTSDGGLTKESLDGDEALHLQTFNFAAYDLSTTINASDMEYIHIDVYPVNASDVTIHINGDETTYVSKSLTAGQWNSFDIALSDFAGQSMASVSSLKLTGADGQDADGTKDLYVDNIYFWTTGSGSSDDDDDDTTITAAPTPTQEASSVKSIFSNAYSSSGSYANWWSGQATKEDSQLATGDDSWHISNFLFIGIEHDKMDVSDMDYLHLDVYPVGSDLTLSVFPINRNASDTDNETEVYQQVTATAGKWNQIDLSVPSYISAGLTMTRAYQIKLTGANGNNGDGVAEFYLDNVYYWTSVASGINGAASNLVPVKANIYSLDGRLVRKDATSTAGLPKGIYIVGGRKVAVR